MTSPSSRPTPVAIIVLAIFLVLPAFSAPFMLSALPGGEPVADTVRTFICIWPFYLLLSGWLAVKAWPSRPEVSWILLAVMLLTSAGMFWLVLHPELLL